MTDTLYSVLSRHQATVHCVRFTQDGSYCMTGSADRSIKLWNPHKLDPNQPSSFSTSLISGREGLFILSYDGAHGYPVLDIAITQDKSRFFSVGEDRTCFLWDVATNKVIRRIQAHNHRTNAVIFNQDDSVAITASYDQTVKCWDLRAASSRDPIQTMNDFKDSVTALARTDDHSILASSVDGSVHIYDLRHGCMHVDQVSKDDPITSLQVQPEDPKTYLITCLGSPNHQNLNGKNVNGRICLMDLQSGQLLQEYTGHQHTSLKIEAAYDLSSQDSKSPQIVAGSEDSHLYRWDMVSGKLLSRSAKAVHAAKKGGIASIAVASTSGSQGRDGGGCHMISSGYDGSVKCWQ